MAVSNYIRKFLAGVHKKNPALLKYLVAEPKYWDLEAPKYFVPNDHDHPTAKALPDVDYTTPDPGVRELDGAVAKEGFHYWTRDRRRTGPRAVTGFLEGNTPDEVKASLLAIQSEVLVKSYIKKEDPLHARLLNAFADSIDFHGRPSLDFPNNRDTTGVHPEAEDEFFNTRYHSHEVHDEWVAQEHARLDASPSSSSRILK